MGPGHGPAEEPGPSADRLGGMAQMPKTAHFSFFSKRASGPATGWATGWPIGWPFEWAAAICGREIRIVLEPLGLGCQRPR